MPTLSCPGATYTEKSGTFVNTEGRVQMTNRAGFAPGNAKEDWAILRALSDVLGKKLPFDSLAALRSALYAEYPHLAAIDCDRGRRSCRHRKLANASGSVEKTAFVSPIKDFYRTQPDGAGFCRHGRMLCARQGRLQAGSRVGGEETDMEDIFVTYILPLLIILGKSRAAAGRDAADHRLPASGGSQDLGGRAVASRPERCRSFRVAAVLRRSSQVRCQGTDHSVWCQQGAFSSSAAPLVLSSGHGRLGGYPGQRRLGGGQRQCRHPLRPGDFFAGGVRRDHGGMGFELEVSDSSAHCAPPRRWSPTKSPSVSSLSRSCSVLVR